MNNPLKILHSEAAVSFGGQEHRILKEMVAMRNAGHTVELACRPHAQLVERMQDLGFKVHKVPMEGRGDFFKATARFRKILKEGKFDVLNTHSRKDTLVAALGGRLAGTPLIVRTRHLASSIGSLLSYTWLPHRVSTVSDHVTEMVKTKGVPEYKVKTIYTPVEPPPADVKPILRQELGLADTDVIILCVAVMRADKGHLFLLDSVKDLLHKHPEAHLVLAGSGEPTFGRVKDWVAEHKLESQIHLLGYRRDVPNLMASADIFTLATRKEALGTVFLEAQQMGLPVVATDVGGVSETFIEGESGLLVPLDDSQKMAAAIEKLVVDQDLRRSMGARAKEWLQNEPKFTPEYLARHTTEVYAQWLSELRR